MKRLFKALTLDVVSAGAASARATGGAEENLNRKNIVLPPASVACCELCLRGARRQPPIPVRLGSDQSTPRGKSGQGSYARAGYRRPVPWAESSRQHARHPGQSRQGQEDREGPRMVNSAPGFTDQPKVINGSPISWSKSSVRRSANMPAPRSAWPSSPSASRSRLK